MSEPLEAAKDWLGLRYVLHLSYRAKDNPQHSSYALVDLRETFKRVRARQPAQHRGQVVALRRIFAEYKAGVGR
jgi:hypothetical protein